jgi:hypothetical protein
LQKLDDGDLPDPKYLWKEFCGAMRGVEGHNSRTRPPVDKYWASEGALEWPKKAILKASRSIPVQVVELPEIGGWMCPVKAYWQWQDGKKNKTVGGKALFCWDDESLITLSENNWILSVILEGEEPRITTSAFRHALPTILARQGASEESLKSLGRWTSRTYLHYVREGRSADCQGLLKKLRN